VGLGWRRSSRREGQPSVCGDIKAPHACGETADCPAKFIGEGERHVQCEQPSVARVAGAGLTAIVGGMAVRDAAAACVGIGFGQQRQNNGYLCDWRLCSRSLCVIHFSATEYHFVNTPSKSKPKSIWRNQFHDVNPENQLDLPVSGEWLWIERWKSVISASPTSTRRHMGVSLCSISQRRIPAPDLGIAGAIIRKLSPQSWPPNGVPPSFKNYMSLYELMLVKSAVLKPNGEVEKVFPISPVGFACSVQS
jgi:hypothetical protein